MAKGPRGGTSGGATGGLSGGSIGNSRSLISERERYGKQVDETLELLRDIYDEYGISVNDMLVSKIKDRGGMTLGYYDWSGNVGINEKVFQNPAELDKIMDRSAKSGFHPSRGSKSGLEAVLAHELGHRLNYVAGGGTWDKLDSSAQRMVSNASKQFGMGNKVKQFRARISGYAESENAEAVAEAFADVYCNGSKAKAESRALYNELRKELGK